MNDDNDDNITSPHVKAIHEVPDTSDHEVVAEPIRVNEIKGLGFQRLGDRLSRPRPERRWLIRDRLIAGGMSIVAGKPKAGKSTLARTLIAAVALGHEMWLNRFHVDTIGSVLYLAVEEKEDEVDEHLRMLGITPDDNRIHVRYGAVPPDVLPRLAHDIEMIRPVLIVADPLLKVLPIRGGQSADGQNSSTGLSLQRYVDMMRITGAHLMFVHHLGKTDREDGDAVLGPQAIIGTADTAMFVKRRKDGRTLGSLQRYGKDLDPPVAIVLQDDGSLIIGEEAKNLRAKETRQLVVKIIKAAVVVESFNSVHRVVKGGRRELLVIWNEMLKEGEIVKTVKGYTFKGSDLDLSSDNGHDAP